MIQTSISKTKLQKPLRHSLPIFKRCGGNPRNNHLSFSKNESPISCIDLNLRDNYDKTIRHGEPKYVRGHPVKKPLFSFSCEGFFTGWPRRLSAPLHDEHIDFYMFITRQND